MHRKRKRRRHPLLKPVPGDNSDKAVFRMLERLDRQLGNPRRVDFYLYFPSRRKTECAFAELLCLGLKAEIIAVERKWLCLGSKMIVPTLNAFAGMRRVLEDIAQRCGGRYDGWETMILE
ncbi:MAG: ribonuclease E inhibitor RraB [Bacteroidota bacterium]